MLRRKTLPKYIGPDSHPHSEHFQRTPPQTSLPACVVRHAQFYRPRPLGFRRASLSDPSISGVKCSSGFGKESKVLLKKAREGVTSASCERPLCKTGGFDEV